MSDNTPIRPIANQDTITVATDDISGVHYPIYKMAYGALDTATLVSPSNPMPVELVFGSTTVAGDNRLPVETDVDTRSILQAILLELKAANLKLSHMSDLHIDAGDAC